MAKIIIGADLTDTFDSKSITKTNNGYFTQALTKQGTTEYITFDQVKKIINDLDLKQDKDNNIDLTTASKNIVSAINEINAKQATGWIVGEYKHMPIGSTMPDGWIKVNLGDFNVLHNGSFDYDQTLNLYGPSSGNTPHLSIRPGIASPKELTDIDYWNEQGQSLFRMTFKSIEIWQYMPNKKKKSN